MGFSNLKQQKNRKKRIAISDINITPFVDVLLVLLIIFMVAAPMMTSGITIDLPQGVATPEVDKVKSITISIKENKDIFIGDDLIKPDNLMAKIAIIANNDFGIRINVRADKNLDYGKVMEVVKNINLAGFSQVILVTELVQ
jgi:biopolymer transport protein TolR